MMRVLLINDTRGDLNPGCQSTVSSLVDLLERQLGAKLFPVSLGTGYEHFAGIESGDGAQAAWTAAVDGFIRDPSISRLLDDADRVVVNLEGTFHHQSIGALTLGGFIAMAHRRRVPVWAVNGTIQAIEPWLLDATLARAEHVAVREPRSAAWLESQRVPHVLASDCAFLADIFEPDTSPVRVPVRSVLYTPGVFGRSDQARHVSPDTVVAHLEALRAHGWKPMYFEMEPAESAISDRVCEQGWPVVRVTDVSWRTLGSWLRRFDLVVSGRYHVLLFAARAGTPWVALPSNTWKIEGLLEHLDDGAGVADSVADFDARVSHAGARRDLHATIERCQQLAQFNLPVGVARQRRPASAVLTGPTAATTMPLLFSSGDIVHVPWPAERMAEQEAACSLASAMDAVPILGGTRLIAGLERVAPRDLADVLIALRAAGDGPVAVTIDTAPDADWNRTHLTVRPLVVWRRMLAAAGFEVISDVGDDQPETRSSDWSVREHWLRLNPFRDAGGSARRSLLLRPTNVPDAALVRETIARLLGLAPTVATPAALDDPQAHVVFLIGTYQEFRQYLAIWPSLPRGSYSVLLRTGLPQQGWARRERCIDTWLTTRGIDVRLIRSVRDVAWADYRQERVLLVTGADSSAYDSHLWNSSVVVAAREHGWRSVQLQHGIWPYADLSRPMAMLSDAVLTWSDEFECEMSQVVSWPDGRTSRRGESGGPRYVPTGNPLFDRYANGPDVALEDLLGDWVLRFDCRLLVATNLHWTQHRDGARVDPAVLRLAASMPATLFIVKLHPVHDIDDAMLRECPPNVQLIDEFVCLCADLDSAKLVAATDGVIATQSTVALEAALARKPFLVVATGNPNRYEHVTPVPAEDLSIRVADLRATPEAAAFRDHYFDVRLLGRGLPGVLEAMVAELERPQAMHADRGVALARFAEYFSVYSAELSGTQTELLRARTALEVAEASVREGERVHARLFADLQTQARWAESQMASLRAALESERELRAARDRALVAPTPGRRVRIALFGAGAAGRLLLPHVRAVPHLDVVCFLDNNPTLWGTMVDDVTVAQPDTSAFDHADVIAVSSQHVASITAQVCAAGYAHKVLADTTVLEQLVLHRQSA